MRVSIVSLIILANNQSGYQSGTWHAPQRFSQTDHKFFETATAGARSGNAGDSYLDQVSFYGAMPRTRNPDATVISLCGPTRKYRGKLTRETWRDGRELSQRLYQLNDQLLHCDSRAESALLQCYKEVPGYQG